MSKFNGDLKTTQLLNGEFIREYTSDDVISGEWHDYNVEIDPRTDRFTRFRSKDRNRTSVEDDQRFMAFMNEKVMDDEEGEETPLTPFTQDIHMPVINLDGSAVKHPSLMGEEVAEIRTVAAPMWAWLHPDEPIVVVDLGDVVKEEDIDKSVVYQGKKFRPDYAWGSAVKSHRTYGLQSDPLAEIGEKAEDGLRFGRWMMANALWGAAIGKMRIGILPPGTVLPDGTVIHDGCGVISEEVERIVGNEQPLIKLGEVRSSFHLQQRVDWDLFKDEALPLVEKRMSNLGDLTEWIRQTAAGEDERKELLALNGDMDAHPYLVNFIERAKQEAAVRMATTVPMPTKYRVAVPSTCETITANGKHVLARYPIDSNSSTTAVDAKCDQKEIERVELLRTVQYSLGNRGFMAKGISQVLPKENMLGYDMIVCSKDIKMAIGSLDAVRKTACLEDVFYIGFTGRWSEGSAVGVNMALWEEMGGDVDGDGAVIIDCAQMPKYWAAVKALPENTTHKLNKSNTPLSERRRMIVNSIKCSTLVGMATNIAATTFAMRDRNTLARGLGYVDGVIGLDKQLTWLIKVGTDGFKSIVDVDEALRQCARLQTQLIKVLGKNAPWVTWSRHKYAFKTMVPEFERENMSRDELEICVPDKMDGTIAQILRITLPAMKNTLGNLLRGKPLMAFHHWAPSATKEDMDEARKLSFAYNRRIKAMNWAVEDSVSEFKAWWLGELKTWGYTREHAAALWRVTHETRSETYGAGAVFIGFPEFAKEFVGRAKERQVEGNVVVNGLQFAFDEPPAVIGGNVKITSFTDNKRKLRSIVVGHIRSDQRKEMSQGYPDYTLGAIASNSETPANGYYNVQFVQFSSGSWHAKFVPVTPPMVDKSSESQTA